MCKGLRKSPLHAARAGPLRLPCDGIHSPGQIREHLHDAKWGSVLSGRSPSEKFPQCRVQLTLMASTCEQLGVDEPSQSNGRGTRRVEASENIVLATDETSAASS